MIGDKIEELLLMFKHVFRLRKDDHTLIRNTRLSVPIELLPSKQDAAFKRTYNGDNRTCRLIISLLKELTDMGLGQFTQPRRFVSPLFVRLRNTEESHKMIRDPSYIPKARLISDFSFINALTVKLNSFLPSTRQVLHSITSTNFVNSFDLKSAFRSMPINHNHLDQSVIGIRNVACMMLVTLEGLANAPVVFHSCISDGLLFSNPDFDKRKEDIDLYEQERSQGKRREIETIQDLKHYLASTTDSFDSPETILTPELPYHQIPDDVKNSETHKLRVKLSKNNGNPDLVRRGQINPYLLSDEDTASPYMDDVITFSRDHKQYFKDLLSFFIDISNLGVKLNITKCKFGAIFKGKGQIDHLGVTILPNGEYTSSVDRSAKIQNLQPPKDY